MNISNIERPILINHDTRCSVPCSVYCISQLLYIWFATGPLKTGMQDSCQAAYAAMLPCIKTSAGAFEGDQHLQVKKNTTNNNNSNNDNDNDDDNKHELAKGHDLDLLLICA